MGKREEGGYGGVIVKRGDKLVLSGGTRTRRGRRDKLRTGWDSSTREPGSSLSVFHDGGSLFLFFFFFFFFFRYSCVLGFNLFFFFFFFFW